jgi:transposase
VARDGPTSQAVRARTDHRQAQAGGGGDRRSSGIPARLGGGLRAGGDRCGTGAAATSINLSDHERTVLEGWISAGTTQQRHVFRARIILMADGGRTNVAIADELETRPTTVGRWRTRFAEQRLEGLLDAPRSGRPADCCDQTERRILAMLDEPPPEGCESWNGRLLAEALGDVSADHVWRVLRRHGISLHRRRSFCVSTAPKFVPKAADIVGLHLAPPEHAVVLCVDEKPSIQALERTQGWLRLPSSTARMSAPP